MLYYKMKITKENINMHTSIHGRIMQVRNMSNIIFFDIYTSNEKIQCMLLKSEVAVDKISKGDLVECDGIISLSSTNHVCLKIENIKIITKSELLIPDTWMNNELAIKDIQVKQNNESLYLLVNGPKIIPIYRTLMKLQNNMRNYLINQNFEEVKTPILQLVASGAIAKPFITHHNALGKNIEIRIAPELMLKRLLIGGYHQIFEIGQCFRNEGTSPAHLQEFTMLEAYKTITNDYDKEYVAWQNFTKELLYNIVCDIPNSHIDANKILNMPIITYSDLLKKYINYDLFTLWNDANILQELCIKYKIDTKEYITKDDQIERLYKLHARPHLIDPIMVIDYPVMPLAKSRGILSYQFQVLIHTHEVVKACIEEDNYEEQNRKFAEQDAKKGFVNGEIAQSDDSFIECMKLGFPPAAGIGIGLNRLTQIITNTFNIKDTVMFSL